MAVRNNNINTKISVDASGASKSTTKFFKDIRKGQDKVTKGGTSVNKSIGKTGKAAGAAGASAGKGFGMFGKALGAAKSGVLSMIPALGGLSAAIAATGIGAILIAVVALGAAFIGLVKKGAQFGKAVSDLRAISGGTEKEIGALTQQAKMLGATTVFSASEVVLLQTELAKLGFTAKNIQDATPSILDLAAALDVELADAASFAGATINAFGLETTDTKRVVDVMALSAVSSAQDFGTLVESFTKAAPAANALGVSVERTAVLLGVLADSNIKGGLAGTALKNSFIELKKRGLTLDEGLAQVAGSSDKLGTAIQLAGKIGGPALLILANKKDDLAGLTEAMNNAGAASEVAGQQFEGTAQRIAAIRNDNLQGDLKGLSSAWEGLMLSFEDGTGPLNDIARYFTQTLTTSLRLFTTTVQFLGFAFKDIMEGLKVNANGAALIVTGAFIKLGGYFKLFANEAKLAFSEVPIIGGLVDAGKAQANIDSARAQIDKAGRVIQAGLDVIAKRSNDSANFMQRFREDQELQSLESTNKKKARMQEAADAEASEKAKEAAKKKAAADAKTFKKLEEKILKEQQNLEDKTAEEKLQRKRERQIAELDDLAVSETKKRELIAEINSLYDDKAAELKATKDEKEAEEKLKADELKAELLLEAEAMELARILESDKLTFDERLKLQEDYLEKKRLNDIGSEKLTAEQIDLVNKKAEKAKDKIRKIEAKSSKDLKDKVLDDALNGAAESFGIAQEVAVAKMIMAAPEAISGSFKEAAKAYAPPMSLAMGALGAAGTVVPIIKGLADIKKTRFSKKGKSGGGGGGGSISTPSAGGGGGGAAGINPEAIADIASNNAARLGIDPSIGNAAGAGAANSVMGGSANRVVFSESAYSAFQDQVDFKESKTTID
tara:strand:+ start:14347 stop:17037 length:2691 start_codon:yes stop_codon:yes gene_type:complete